MKRIYLSGPMTGIPEHNFPAFNAEAARLRALGYDVINPVDINPDPGKSWHECLRADLKALLDCDTIAMLDGWMNSNGAHLEMHIAHRVGIRVINSGEILVGRQLQSTELCSDRVPLPNVLWIRSTEMPEWAICLDPEARHYGWKMYECNGAWVSGSALGLDEVDSALVHEGLRDHWPLFQALHDKLAAA